MHDGDDRRWSAAMAAAQEGDAAAYGRLMAELLPVVRRMVRRRLAAPAAGDAEDVVQESLLTLHSIRHTYDPARPFLPWLSAIVAHRCADAARRDSRRRRHVETVDELPETLGAVETNMVVMDSDALRRAVAALPESQRQAVDLVKLREMSLDEAAAVAQTSSGALKVAVHRAIKSLQRMLDR